MKKLIVVVISLGILICLNACSVKLIPDVEDEKQTLTFIEAKFYDNFDDKECVGLYFEYKNESGDSKCSTDGFVMAVKQGGKLLDTLWVSKEIDGAITPSTSVETGTTVRVVYLFALRDDSQLSVIVSDGQEFTINYEQIKKI